jgi:hypothetical protein
MILDVAAGWAMKPTTQALCSSQNEQWNGESPWPACILSNAHFYAEFEPSGGRLVNLFFLDANGPHQLIGPTSQFAVGLSDPSTWNLSLGEQADPGAIEGAFGDAAVPWAEYQPSVQGNTLTFTSPDGRTVKTFHLTETGLDVNVRTPGAFAMKIPLAVDPAAFYFGPTNYTGSLAPGSWTWGMAGGLQVEVSSEAALSAAGFSDGRTLVSAPEDPNLDYPAGSYLPFPVSVVTLRATDGIHVRITVR